MHLSLEIGSLESNRQCHWKALEDASISSMSICPPFSSMVLQKGAGLYQVRSFLVVTLVDHLLTLPVISSTSICPPFSSMVLQKGAGLYQVRSFLVVTLVDHLLTTSCSHWKKREAKKIQERHQTRNQRGE